MNLNDMIMMVPELSDEELGQLSSAITNQFLDRAKEKFRNGEFQALNANETDLLASQGKIQAIKAYKDRTKVSLSLAKLVVENYSAPLNQVIINPV